MPKGLSALCYSFFSLTLVLSWLAFSDKASSINCPDYGCLPRVIDNKIVITDTGVTGEAAGIQYHKAFVIDCRTGQYRVLNPYSRQQLDSGNIYSVSAENIDSIMAATIGLSCNSQHGKTEAESCNQVISNAVRQLEIGRDLNTEVSIRDISRSYSSYPANRSNEYVFAMSGQAVNSVLSSPQFLTIIATTVIEACDSISMVRFGLSGSGLSGVIGLLPGGRVDLFTCLDENPRSRLGQKLEWGTYYCSL